VISGGVGLLQGGYGIVEKGTWRPLRCQRFNPDEGPSLDKNGMPLLTLEGNTPAVIIFFLELDCSLIKRGRY
jgi:hypothetical protein